jgi:stage III sporulation protein AG
MEVTPLVERWFGGKATGGGGGKPPKKWGWILTLGVAGVVVMTLPSLLQVKQEVPPEPRLSAAEGGVGALPASAKRVSTMQEYELEYEQELSNVLSKIVGVEDVSVIVNLDSTEEEVVQVDERQSEQVTTETDKTGGKRNITQNTDDRKTAYYRTNNGEEPVVIKRLKPKVRGVLVVARGVENLQVKAAVIEAVQRTLDVPMHRISVLPKG